MKQLAMVNKGIPTIQKGLTPRRKILFDLLGEREMRLVIPGIHEGELRRPGSVSRRYARLNPTLKEEKAADPYLEFKPAFSSTEHVQLEVFKRWMSPEKARKRGVRIFEHATVNVLHKKKPTGETKEVVLADSPAKFCSFFSNTSKMACGSWSIPAGGVSMGGTCPSANTTSEVETYDPASFKNAVRTIPKLAEKLTRESGTFPRKLPMVDSPPLTTLGLERNICQKCVTGDARIPVRGAGLIPMREVVDDVLYGRRVEVQTERGWSVATNAWRNGAKPVVRVETTSGYEITCTPDHKILTRSGWKAASELLPGDKLFLPSDVPSDGLWPVSKSTPASEQPMSECSRSTRGQDFPVEWTKEVGLVLGYILGDGCVSKDEYPEVKIAGSAEDAGDVAEIFDIMTRWSGSDSKRGSVKAIRPNANRKLCKSGGTATAFGVRKKNLVRFLSALGLDKSPAIEDRRVPSGIWDAPESAVCGFISGMFSTDGSIGTTKMGKVAVSLASVSIGLLREIQVILMSLGIRSSICEYKSNSERGYKALYKLEVSSKSALSRFRDKIGFHNSRKGSKLESASLEYRERAMARGQLATVSQVIEAGVAEVYDIEVEDETHSFVANGLVVHNCYAAKGNFGNSNTQLWQMARFAWAFDAVERGTFVEEMTAALRAFLSHEKARASKKQDPRFFRIHDSGDFFSPEYMLGWARVAANLPEVRFWAPTRVWMLWPEQVAEAVAIAPNLTLRPSALQFDDPAPIVDGIPVAGSTAHVASKADALEPARLGLAQWDCPAYALAGKACAGAMDSKKIKTAAQRKYIEEARGNFRRLFGTSAPADCRVCWLKPETTVSYHAH